MAQRRKRRTKAQIEADKAKEAEATATLIVDPEPMPTEPDPEDSAEPTVVISEEAVKEELVESVEPVTDEPKRAAAKFIAPRNEEAGTLSECPDPPCISRARWKRGRKKGRW